MKLFFGFLALAAALILGDKRSKRALRMRSNVARITARARVPNPGNDARADRMRDDDMWRAASAASSFELCGCCCTY